MNIDESGAGYTGINPVADRDGERYPIRILSDTMNDQIATLQGDS